MIKIILAHIRNHLGFSRSEANGLLLLLPIMLLSIFLLQWYNQYLRESSFQAIDYEALEKWKNEVKASIEIKEAIEPISQPTSIQKFRFNPNKVSHEEIVSLGFSKAVASNWSKYLKAGAEFQKKEDLLKIYGIDKNKVTDLWSYIDLPIPSNNSSREIEAEKEESQVALMANPIAKIDLNMANAEELKRVYGIGEVLSIRIIKFRDKLGGFHSLEQLNEIYGLKADAIANISEKFTVSRPHKFLRVNSDSIKTLANHPYLNYNHARAIVNYRSSNGQFADLNGLSAIKILNDSLLIKIAPYVKID